LESTVSDLVQHATTEEAQWRTVRDDYHRALVDAEQARAHKDSIEQAYQRALERQNLQEQLLHAAGRLRDSTTKSDALRSQLAEAARQLEDARGNLVAASAVVESSEHQVNARATVLKSSAALSRAQERLDQARSALQRATDEHAARSIRVETLRGALQRDRETALQAHALVDRMGALIREISVLQAANESQCLLCGHDHGSPKTLHDAITLALARTAARKEDLAREEALRAELSRAEKEVLASRELMQRETAGIAAASAALSSAQQELAALPTVSSDSDADVTAILQTARGDAARAREVAARAEQQSRRCTVEVDRATAELSQLQALVRSLEDRVRAVDGVELPGPSVLEPELAHAAAALNAATDRARAADAGQRTAAQQRDAAQSELAVTRKARNDADAELLAAQRAKEELQLESVGLLSTARALQIEVPHFDGIEEALLSFIQKCEAVASEAGVAGATCAHLVSRVESLEATTVLPQLEEEYSALNGALETLNAQAQGFMRAEARMNLLQSEMEIAVQRAAEARLRQSDESINEVLSLLTPHRHLNLVSVLRDGTMSLLDEALRDGGVDPKLYSSTGQLTCLALALFVGVSVLQSWSKLDLILLDEPVQHLDDVKFLNFIELTKRLASTKQVVISTADRNIGELLRLKLGRWAEATKMTLVVHDFIDFDRETGPRFAADNAAVLGQGSVSVA